MTALDRVLPTPRKLELSSVELALAPERAWEIVRHGDLARSSLVKALFAVRTLPSRFIGTVEKVDLRIDALTSSAEHPGFQILIDEPREVVVGAIGKVWKLDIPFVHVDGPDAYAAFDEAGWVKVAWALRVLPLGDQNSRVELEVCVDATDEASWRRFERYWVVVGPGSHLIRRTLFGALARAYGAPDTREKAHDGWRDVAEGAGGAAIMVAAMLTPFLRSGQRRWGVDEATAARAYPGDDRIPSPSSFWTHGIVIDAPAEEVWPWIAQIGADRAGFYSYQWLENIVGCDVRNAERVHPEWEVKVGDGLKLHPEMPALPVVEVERGRHWLAFGAADPAAKAAGKGWVETSWLFFLEPLGPTRCRFISRYRTATSGDLSMKLAYGAAIEPIGFAMDRRMLLGVKERVERRAP